MRALLKLSKLRITMMAVVAFIAWGASRFAQAPPGPLMISSIPFGEMNGGEVYNASDIVPLADSRFLFCDNKLKDIAGPWTTGALEAQTPIHLSIEPAAGDQGIRCLYDDPDRGGFLVIIGKSAKDSEAPYSLYEWNGAADGVTRRLNVVFAKKMKPEGVTRGVIGGRHALVIVDDGGGFQVIWDSSLPYAGISFRN